MKVILLTVFAMILSFSNVQKNPSDFDSQLFEIARKFRDKIMDEDECSNLKKETSNLIDEIEDAIEMEDDYSRDEILKLKKLKKEANALEEFIAAIGDCGNAFLTTEELNLANQRVNADLSYVIRDKYCIDIILVEIDDYVAYLAENDSTKDFRVAYQWKARFGINSGDGTFGLLKYNVRQIYNNREKVDKKDISFFGITCKEF